MKTKEQELLGAVNSDLDYLNKKYAKMLTPQSWKDLDAEELAELSDTLDERLRSHVGKIRHQGLVLAAAHSEPDPYAFDKVYPISIKAYFTPQSGGSETVVIRDALSDGGYETLVASILEAAQMADKEVNIELT